MNRRTDLRQRRHGQPLARRLKRRQSCPIAVRTRPTELEVARDSVRVGSVETQIPAVDGQLGVPATGVCGRRIGESGRAEQLRRIAVLGVGCAAPS